MKNHLIAIAILTVALAACGKPAPAKNPDPNHTHADFAVWIDGKQMDYSDERYMSAELTPEQEEELKTHNEAVTNPDAEMLKKYLHLHDGNGHIMHRHKPGLTVADFFKTLQIDISGSCYTSFEPMADGQVCGSDPFRMFVNGMERAALDMKYDFADGDHILITNAVDPAEVQKELNAMTDDACMYSKTCPERGPAPTEHCIADPEVPCVQ
jgi:predicted small lipoprotein YifL